MMTATLDKWGRVTIPHAIRHALGLKPGAKLRWEMLPTGCVRITPVGRVGKMNPKSGLFSRKGIRNPEHIALDSAARDQRLEASDMLTLADAADCAGVDEASLARWAKRGRCIALADSNGRLRLPKWQFEPPLWDALLKLAKALGTTDGWALLAFLETPLGALDGATPRAAIERGLADRVVRLAGFDE